MSGVSGMNYMYSLSASSGGGMTLYVDFQLGTDINTDQILAQMRQRAGELAAALRGDPARRDRAAGNHGAVHAARSLLAERHLRQHLPRQLRHHQLAVCADAHCRGVGQVQIFGAGPYAMRIWVNPDTLANLGVTVSDITNAVQGAEQG